jgi:hypothetical protein
MRLILAASLCVISITLAAKFVLAGPAKAQELRQEGAVPPTEHQDFLPQCSEPVVDDKPLPRDWPCKRVPRKPPPFATHVPNQTLAMLRSKLADDLAWASPVSRLMIVQLVL